MMLARAISADGDHLQFQLPGAQLELQYHLVLSNRAAVLLRPVQRETKIRRETVAPPLQRKDFAAPLGSVLRPSFPGI